MLLSPVVFSLISLTKPVLTSGTFSTGAKPFVFKVNVQSSMFCTSVQEGFLKEIFNSKSSKCQSVACVVLIE